jgi:hypothetical protein
MVKITQIPIAYQDRCLTTRPVFYYLGNKEPHVGQAFQPDFSDTSGWKA